MAYEADSVVVSLIADNSQFDAAAKSSASNFSKSMSDIQSSGAAAEGGVARFSSALKENRLAMNQSRVGMLEFQHAARGVADQLAVGAPATTILTSHLGELSEAVVLSGSAFGKLGAFLQGPWGIALTLATVVGAKLVSSLVDQKDALDAAIEKMQKHHDEALIQADADRAWATSIDGLYDALKKLDDELQKEIGLTEQTPQDKLADALAKRKDLQDQLNKAIAQEVELRKQLAAQPAGTVGIGQGAQTSGVISSGLAAQIDALQTKIDKLKSALALAQQTVRDAGVAVAQAAGNAAADASKHADEFAKELEKQLAAAGSTGKVAVADLAAAQAALQDYRKAEQEAVAQGVDIQKVGAESKVKSLTSAFVDGKTPLDTYTKSVEALVAALNKAAAAAKSDPIKQFKEAIIGAEGTGPNRLGSSAAGFGQFMPSTFEYYFKQAYPQQAATLTSEQIDALRNNRQVAEGVIDAATKDYVAVLQRAGQNITAASLYTMHLLSAGDPRGRVALRLLNAPSDEPTSDFLSSRVLAGNPFLAGTSGDARAAIAKRIGDSDSAISAGATALQKQLDDQVEAWQKLGQKIAEEYDKEKDITVEKEAQVNYIQQFNEGSGQTLSDLSKELAGYGGLDKALQKIADSQKELNDLGGQMIDDIFNPDNWKSWGDLGKVVLHDIEMEFIKLAAINPLKNLLYGSSSNLPTLTSVFSLLGLGGGGGSPNLGGMLNFSGFSDFGGVHFAGGGLISGPGSGTSDSIPARLSDGEYVLKAAAVRSIGVKALDALNDGKIRLFSDGGLVRRVSPSNASASSPFGSFGHGFVLVQVQASPYFDGRVMEVAGPVIAQSAVQSATGGAAISRRNLGREAQHRLE